MAVYESAMGEWLLLQGGHVVTMDADLGELPSGDVLIEDGRIAAVAERHRRPATPSALDVAGHVVMPGFVDTHRHTWQTPFRGALRGLDAERLLRGIRLRDLAATARRRTFTRATTSARSRRSTPA